ncbi:MAG: hypothetical protein IKO52_04910 [Clostridia bacterium]|nr:hypothetical protein [Clostridia bacterium]
MKPMIRKVGRQAVSVVNFEGMNRVPQIKGLKEVRGQVVPGMTNTWYEYVPACYEAGSPLPLVIQLHGGGNDGRRWADYTVWHEMAERKGLIVVYPNSPDYECWACSQRDIQYLYDLIQLLCEKYAIDKGRIYMQGMSNGDQMTLAFTMAHPEVLAAAGYATGPSDEEVLDGDLPIGPLPIIQMRGEMDINWKLMPDTPDIYENRYHMNDLNREIWLPVNDAENCLPALSIEGKDNFLYYPGEKAPIINWEIASMGHREPVYGAQVFWDRLYSGCRRKAGELVFNPPDKPIAEDDNTVLIAMGSHLAYRKNGFIPFGRPGTGAARMFMPAELPHFCPVKTGEMCETEVLCAPAEFFSAVYGASVTYENAGETCVLAFPDGRRVILRASAVLFEDNGEFRALQKPCAQLCGSFFVPVGELCQMLFGSHVSMADDVLCISDHYAVLGRYTARVIRRLLGGEMRPRKKE